MKIINRSIIIMLLFTMHMTTHMQAASVGEITNKISQLKTKALLLIQQKQTATDAKKAAEAKAAEAAATAAAAIEAEKKAAEAKAAEAAAKAKEAAEAAAAQNLKTLDQQVAEALSTMETALTQ